MRSLPVRSIWTLPESDGVKAYQAVRDDEYMQKVGRLVFLGGGGREVAAVGKRQGRDDLRVGEVVVRRR